MHDTVVVGVLHGPGQRLDPDHGRAVDAVRGPAAAGVRRVGSALVLTILGESGSGKIVTLRSLVRLLPKVRTRISGEVVLKGMDLYELPEHEVQDIRGGLVAMIFQEPMTALDPVYTVGEQIVETLVRHQEMSREQAQRRALELLEIVQIPSPARRLKSYPHEMSGGMRQRAMIAIALACNP